MRSVSKNARNSVCVALLRSFALATSPKRRYADGVKITVRVKPKAKKNHIEIISHGEYIAQIRAAPIDGKANGALIKLLAAHFDIAASRIRIVSGRFSSKKIIEVR